MTRSQVPRNLARIALRNYYQYHIDFVSERYKSGPRKGNAKVLDISCLDVSCSKETEYLGYHIVRRGDNVEVRALEVGLPTDKGRLCDVPERERVRLLRVFNTIDEVAMSYDLPEKDPHIRTVT